MEVSSCPLSVASVQPPDPLYSKVLTADPGQDLLGKIVPHEQKIANFLKNRKAQEKIWKRVAKGSFPV
jgi:hypothetical protein